MFSSASVRTSVFPARTRKVNANNSAALTGRSTPLIMFSVNSAPSIFFFSSRRRHTRLQGDWSSDVCSSDLFRGFEVELGHPGQPFLPVLTHHRLRRQLDRL